MQPQKPNDWVLVCDGRKALIFENTGSDLNPRLETNHVEEQEDLPSREINSDAPGRAFSSVGDRRSSMEEADAHDIAEERFLKSMAERMEKLAGESNVGDLILVAPPRALGVLRPALSPLVKKKLRLEIEKDLVKMPVPKIEQHLARAMQTS